MREIYFLFLFFVFSCLGLSLAREDCDNLDALVWVSGYNRNLTFYGAINGTLKLCQSLRVDLNMSWLAFSPIDDEEFLTSYGIHEVGEYQGVRGGAVGRFRITVLGYQRMEWVSVGAGKIFHCKNISLHGIQARPIWWCPWST